MLLKTPIKNWHVITELFSQLEVCLAITPAAAHEEKKEEEKSREKVQFV